MLMQAIEILSVRLSQFEFDVVDRHSVCLLRRTQICRYYDSYETAIPLP